MITAGVLIAVSRKPRSIWPILAGNATCRRAQCRTIISPATLTLGMPLCQVPHRRLASHSHHRDRDSSQVNRNKMKATCEIEPAFEPTTASQYDCFRPKSGPSGDDEPKRRRTSRSGSAAPDEACVPRPMRAMRRAAEYRSKDRS